MNLTQIAKPPPKPNKVIRSWAIMVLEAGDHGKNRQTVELFLKACGVLPQDREVENWPLRWVPNTPGEIRDLGEAIARFQGGERAQMPYREKV